jgi:hypothetical protein
MQVLLLFTAGVGAVALVKAQRVPPEINGLLMHELAQIIGELTQDVPIIIGEQIFVEPVIIGEQIYVLANILPITDKLLPLKVILGFDLTHVAET